MDNHQPGPTSNRRETFLDYQSLIMISSKMVSWYKDWILIHPHTARGTHFLNRHLCDWVKQDASTRIEVDVYSFSILNAWSFLGCFFPIWMLSKILGAVHLWHILLLKMRDLNFWTPQRNGLCFEHVCFPFGQSLALSCSFMKIYTSIIKLIFQRYMIQFGDLWCYCFWIL